MYIVDLQHAQSIPEMVGPSMFHFHFGLTYRRSGAMSHQGSLGGMPMDSLQDEMNEAHRLFSPLPPFIHRYKLSSGLFVSPQKQIQSSNYVLPSSFIFPRPAVTPENIKSFSVNLIGGVLRVDFPSALYLLLKTMRHSSSEVNRE